MWYKLQGIILTLWISWKIPTIPRSLMVEAVAFSAGGHCVFLPLNVRHKYWCRTVLSTLWCSLSKQAHCKKCTTNLWTKFLTKLSVFEDVAEWHSTKETFVGNATKLTVLLEGDTKWINSALCIWMPSVKPSYVCWLSAFKPINCPTRHTGYTWRGRFIRRRRHLPAERAAVRWSMAEPLVSATSVMWHAPAKMHTMLIFEAPNTRR